MEIIFKILPWVLPPVIGAAIGYITNAIAITMLFRPHQGKKIFSIKIPMTPGIIPKQRYELSKSVGAMVSRELLTEDAVRKQMRSKSFLKSVNSSLGSFLELIINTPVIKLKEKILKSELNFNPGEDSAKSFIAEIVSGFLKSQGFISIISNFLDKGIEYLESKTPGYFINRKKESIINKIITILISEELEKRMIKILDSNLEKAVHENYHLSEILTQNNIKRILSIGRKLYIRLFPHFIHFLNSAEVKIELEVHGRRLIKDIINKLNRIQRFLVSAGQYDKTLDENMSDIVIDTIKNLEDYGENVYNIDNMETGLNRRLVSLSQSTLGQIFIDWDGDLFADLHKILKSFFEFLRNPIVLENLNNWLKALFEKYENIELKIIVAKLLQMSLEDIKEKVLNFIFSKEQNSSNTIIHGSFFSNIFDTVSDYGKKSPGDILNISDDIKSKINKSLSSTLIGIVDEKVPQILESIDINTLVVEKIDTLNMEKVEKLIMDIVRKQLRWINVFGALLGSIIGGAQLIMNMFM